MDASAYLSQLISLLPPGDALAREPGSRLERLLSVPAAELARVDGRVEALLTESDPARTAEMLEDWERALGLPDVCYPNFQFSRASSAWYFDGAGVLREAAVDEPRYLYDDLGQQTDAVLVEAAGTNFLWNSSCANAVAGTPGSLPTTWTGWNAGNGLTRQVVGSGNENGIPYVDVRWFGTATGGLFARLSFTNALTQLPAVALGDTVAASCFIRLVAGAMVRPMRMLVFGLDSAGAYVAAGGVTTVGFTPINAPLNGQRRIGTYLVTNASVVYGQVAMDFLWSVGDVIDVTFRLAAPQIEKGALATSPMLNAIGTFAPTTRAADNLYIATTEERRARILARLIERFEPTPAAIIGLAARLGDTVTLTEFRPHDCADDCEAPVLDDAWAHAFQVAGASQMVVEFTCLDGCETPLSQWRTGAYECAIRRFAPAQSVPIFSYA